MKKILIVSLLSLLALTAFCIEAAPRANPPTVNPPSNLSATAISISQIDLEWQDNSDNETGFKIERSLDGEDFSEVDEVGENITDYSDDRLDPDTTYYYRVRAFKQQGPGKVIYSDYSNIASATTFSLPIPDAPTNLDAEVIATSTTYVLIDWQDNSDNEDGFSLERSTNGVDFDAIASTSENVVYYNDYDVESSMTYYYQVRAFNGYGYSDYSNVDSVIIP